MPRRKKPTDEQQQNDALDAANRLYMPLLRELTTFDATAEENQDRLQRIIDIGLVCEAVMKYHRAEWVRTGIIRTVTDGTGKGN